eukprot:20957-Heterococcus_DN1.PRE.2
MSSNRSSGALIVLVWTSTISMALALQQTPSLSSLQAVARLLPKAELHAHLHGSIRLSTLQELAHNKQLSLPLLAVAKSAVPSLDTCFSCFDAIHQIADNLPTLQRLAHEVFEDFANDGVLYCELRSTPRALHDGTSKRDYILHLLEVLQAVDAFDQISAWCKQPLAAQTAPPTGLIPRLLISIDRSKSAADAMQTCELAVELLHHHKLGKYIAGIDFSGNPNKNTFSDYIPALDHARASGLKIAVHCAEVDNVEDTASILSFQPDRLGHALLLSNGAASLQHMKAIHAIEYAVQAAPLITICDKMPTLRILLCSVLLTVSIQTMLVFDEDVKQLLTEAVRLRVNAVIANALE